MLCSEEVTLPKERSHLCPQLLGGDLYLGSWTVMLVRNVFVCLGALVTGKSGNMIYGGDFGSCYISSTSRRVQTKD